MHKKVELTELFYDLVFVYAISKMMGFIHHLHHGVLPFENILFFLMALVILLNTWMIQTVFTNRYGTNSLFNILFMLLNMGGMIYLSNTFTVDTVEIARNFPHFVAVVGMSTLTMLFQYIIQYKRAECDSDRQVSRIFSQIFGFRLATNIAALFLPLSIGSWVFWIGILVSTLCPLFLTKRMQVVPINFPHLIERVTLLLIIMLGEMIITIAPSFSMADFGLYSVLLFLVIVSLFFFYAVEFDHVIDGQKTGVSGHGLIYLHYPIFFGISVVTVSLTFLYEGHLENPVFVINFLYLGLLSFYLPILAHKGYNKISHAYSPVLLLGLLGTFLTGLVLSYIMQKNSQHLIIILSVTTLIMAIIFLEFNIKRLGISRKQMLFDMSDYHN